MTDTGATLSHTSIPCPVLQQLLSNAKVTAPDGSERKLVDGMGLNLAAALYQTIKTEKPKNVLEIGMANGVSTLAILTALAEVDNGGRLISIDPAQTGHYAGIGLANVQKAGFASRHTLVEQFDYLALPQLLASQQRVQFAYIDGWHTFDYTLLDFFYIDKMLDAGGVVAFNDCGLRAVNRVMGFVRSHRKYLDLDVGLPRDYTGRNPLITLARRLLGFSHEDRYFRKVESFEPVWNFYARF